jgi:hypothetical protein
MVAQGNAEVFHLHKPSKKAIQSIKDKMKKKGNRSTPASGPGQAAAQLEQDAARPEERLGHRDPRWREPFPGLTTRHR